MALNNQLDLPLVDGLALPQPVRALLTPGLMIRSRDGESHRLPVLRPDECAGARPRLVRHRVPRRDDARAFHRADGRTRGSPG